jgi:hypothetical protein
LSCTISSTTSSPAGSRQVARLRTRLVDERRHDALDLLAGHADQLFPAPVPLIQRPVAREELGEAFVRGREDGFVRMRRPHAVAALHLVGV